MATEAKKRQHLAKRIGEARHMLNEILDAGGFDLVSKAQDVDIPGRNYRHTQVVIGIVASDKEITQAIADVVTGRGRKE